jgi:hypothetical protein
MGKIYQLNDAIDHGVTQGNECIDAAAREPPDKQFKKIIHLDKTLDVTMSSDAKNNGASFVGTASCRAS